MSEVQPETIVEVPYKGPYMNQPHIVAISYDYALLLVSTAARKLAFHHWLVFAPLSVRTGNASEQEAFFDSILPNKRVVHAAALSSAPPQGITPPFNTLGVVISGNADASNPVFREHRLFPSEGMPAANSMTIDQLYLTLLSRAAMYQLYQHGMAQAPVTEPLTVRTCMGASFDAQPLQGTVPVVRFNPSKPYTAG